MHPVFPADCARWLLETGCGGATPENPAALPENAARVFATGGASPRAGSLAGAGAAPTALAPQDCESA